MTTTHVNMSAGTRIKNLKCSPSSVPANRLMNTRENIEALFRRPAVPLLALVGHGSGSQAGERSRRSGSLNPQPASARLRLGIPRLILLGTTGVGIKLRSD